MEGRTPVCHVCFEGDIYDQLKDYLNLSGANWTQEEVANIIGLYDTYEPEPLIPDGLTWLTDEQKRQYGKIVCEYARETTKKQRDELADSINHPAIAFSKLYSVEGWDAATRNNRINMVALKFMEVVTRRKDALTEKSIDVTREDVCNGHMIDGKKVDGQMSIFNELFDFFYSEYRRAWDYVTWADNLSKEKEAGSDSYSLDKYAAARHEMDEYAKVLNNWAAICVFVRNRIKDREGIKLGHNLDYAAAADEDDFSMQSIEETYTLEESVREAWMQHHAETSAFATLGKEVRQFLSTVPKTDDDGERMDDDLGYPIFYDPVPTHQYLSERLRGITSETDMCNVLQDAFDSEYDARIMQDVCRHLLVAVGAPEQPIYDEDGSIMTDDDGEPLMTMAFPKEGFTDEVHAEDGTLITQLLVDMHKNFVGYTAMLDGDNGYYIKDLNREQDNPDRGVYLDTVTLGSNASEDTIYDENGLIDYLKYAKWAEEVSRMLPPKTEKSKEAKTTNTSNIFEGQTVYDDENATGYWSKSMSKGDRIEFLLRAVKGLGMNLSEEDIIMILGDSVRRSILLNNLRDSAKFIKEGMGILNNEESQQKALGQLISLESELRILREAQSMYERGGQAYNETQEEIDELFSKQQEALKKLRDDVTMRNVISWTYSGEPNKPPVLERLNRIIDLKRNAIGGLRVERRVSAYDRKGKSNSRYSDVTPSYMGDFVDKIHGYIKAGNGQGLRTFLMEKYGKDAFFYNQKTGKFYNKWLQELYDSSMELDKNGNISDRCFAALFGYTNFLYSKIDDRPVIFENFSSRTHAISMIKSFVQKRDVRKNPSYEYADYPCFILGDAGVQMYFTAKRYSQDDIMSGLVDVYHQELVRMRQVAELRKSLADKKVDADKMPKDYVSAEHVFTTLMFLNPDFEGGKYWKIATGLDNVSEEDLEDNSKREDHVNTLIEKIDNNPALLEAAIKEYMNDTLTKFKDRLCEYEILKKETDGSYKEVAERGKVDTLFGNNARTLYDGNAEALIDDFFWNTKFATIQQIQMFTVDTAFYDSRMPVKDLQKRYKEIYAPGKSVSTQARDRDGHLYSESGQETVIYIDDISESCEWNEEFDEALRTVYKEHPEIYAKYKKGSSLTDGQAWRSLDSYRAVMGMSGEWTNAMQDAYERITEIRNEIKNRPSHSITEAETRELTNLMVMMQPRKPYLFTLEQVDLGNGRVCSIPVQHKYAEIIVIPELLPKGKLKDMAEYMDEKGIDMIASTKCVKVGGFGSCDITEADDSASMWAALDKGYRHKFSYSDYRIQNGVPEHLDQSQLFGTQIRKLIFSNIKQNKDYGKYLNNILRNHKKGSLTINIPGAPNGGQVTLDGKNLIALYNVLIMANMFDSYEQMEKHASTKQDISNMVTQNSIANATQVDDVITGFAIIENGVAGAGDFVMPIGEPMSEHDTTALLLSCLQKGVNKQRILGGSCVQASALGVTPDNPNKPYKEETSSLREVCSKNAEGKYDNVLYEEIEITFARSYTDPTGKEIPLEFSDYCFSDNEGHHNIGDLIPSDVEVKEGDPEWEEYQSYTYKLIDGKWEPCAHDAKGAKVFKPKIEVEFPGILDIIAYRIPTERLYSAVNCKIKRFSHPKLGGVIRVPVSGTTKAGFDFDIDKLYFFMKEFSQEHFNQDTVSDIWEEIYGIDKEGNSTGKTEFPKLYDALKNAQKAARERASSGNLLGGNARISGSSEAVAELNKAAEGVVAYDPKKHVVDYWKDAVIDGKPVEEIYGSSAEVFRKYVEAHPELKGKYHAFDEYDPSASPFNPEKDNDGNVISKGNSRVARNNMLIGIIRERLKDQETFKERYTPGGFAKLSDAALEMRIIQFSDPKDITTGGNIDYAKVREIAKKINNDKDPAKDPEPNYDYSDPSTILIYNQQNQIAAKLIGIFANQNTHHVLCSTLQELKLKDKIAFGDHQQGLDDFLHKDNEDFKAEVDVNVAELLAAAVDAVKDPVLNYLNLNLVTADSAAVLFRLGYSQQEVGLLFNQPIIKEICEYVANNNCSTKTAINEVARRYEVGGRSWKKDKYKPDRATTKILGNNILEGKKAPKDRGDNFKADQLNVLRLFNQIQGVASEMNSFVQATRFTAANSIGSTWGDVIAVMQRTQQFADLVADDKKKKNEESNASHGLPEDSDNKRKDDGPKLIIKTGATKPGEPNKVIFMGEELLELSAQEYAARMYGNPLAFEQCMMDIVRKAKKLFGKYFPYFSDLYETVRGRLSALTDYGTLDADTINSIHRDLAVYLLGLQKSSDFDGETLLRTDVEEDSKTLTERLSYTGDSKKQRDYFVDEFPKLIHDLTVAYREKATKDPKSFMGKYPFYNWLDVRSSKDGKRSWVQIIGVGGMQGSTANQFVEAWTDAFKSDEKITVGSKVYNVSDLALGLFYHNFYRLGFNFNPTSTIHLTPTLLKTMIKLPSGASYADFMNSLIAGEVKLSAREIDAFVRQYILNHLDNYKFVFRPKVGTEAQKLVKERIENSDDDEIFTFTYDILKQKNLVDLFTTKVTGAAIHYKPVICISGPDGKPQYYMAKTKNGEQFNVAPRSDSVVKYVRVYPQGAKGRALDYRAKEDFESYQEMDRVSFLLELGRFFHISRGGLRLEIEHMQGMGIRVHTLRVMEVFMRLHPELFANGTQGGLDGLIESDDIQRLETPSGEVYGFVYRGEIYMDETKLDPQVPVHEYTHIWDEAVMQSSPMLWERGKRLLRDSKNRVLRNLWNEIAESDAYGKKWLALDKTEEEIENLITGEVHARLVGEKGAELLEQIEKAEGGKGLIARLKRWMRDVFKHLAKTFGTWTDDALSKLSLEDFINMPLRDFLDGVNPIREGYSIEMQDIKSKAIADGTFMKAPNGKPTKLSERQWLQVRTSNFLNWFGDWINDREHSSKVIDDLGEDATFEPLVVYHGTPNEFTTFHEGVTKWHGKTGIFFSSDKDYAESMSVAKWISKYANMWEPLRKELNPSEELYTMPVFLNIKNPAEIDHLNHRTVGEYRLKLDANSSIDGVVGHDYYDPDGDLPKSKGIEYAVFDPNQVKSAIDNNGEFSTNDNNINALVIGEKGAAAFDAAEEASIRMDNLAVAIEMENSGKDALMIKQSTGWERGADGKWRYEEMDLQINKEWFDKVKSMELSERRGLSFKLKDIVDSNEISRLIQLYPLIASLTITVANENFFDILQSTRGSYNPETNTLMLNFARVFLGDDVTMESIRSTLMHEIQHLIQTEEGFAEGGNTRVVEDRPEMKKLMQLSDILKSKEDQLFAEENQDNIELINLVETLGEYTEEYKRWEDLQNRRSEINEERRKHNRKVNEERGKLILKQALEYNDLANVKFSAFDKMFRKNKIKEHEAELKKLDQMHERQLEEFDKANPKQPLLREEYFFDGPTYNFSRYSFEERNAMRDLVRELRLQWRRNSEKYKMLQLEISEIQNEIDKTRYNLYSRIAGEVESRTVERRLDLSPEERRNTLFTDEMYKDVAQEDLIFMSENLDAESMYDISPNESDVEDDYYSRDEGDFNPDNVSYADELSEDRNLRNMYTSEEWTYMYDELLDRNPAIRMMAEDGLFSLDDLMLMFSAPERTNQVILEDIRQGVKDGSIIPTTIDENENDIPVCM